MARTVGVAFIRYVREPFRQMWVNARITLSGRRAVAWLILVGVSYVVGVTGVLGTAPLILNRLLLIGGGFWLFQSTTSDRRARDRGFRPVTGWPGIISALIVIGVVVLLLVPLGFALTR